MKTRFVILFFVLLLFLSYTLVQSQSILPGRRTLALFLGFLFFSLIISSQIMVRVSPQSINAPWFQVLCWTGSMGMGLWATFVFFALPLDIGHALFVLSEKMGYAAIQPERRKFLLSGFKLGLLGASSGMMGWGLWEAVSGPKIKEVEVPLPDLPLELHGLKIAQISDLHVGTTIGVEFVQKVVQIVKDLSPDLIVVTGDLVDGSPETLQERVSGLSQLQAPLGTFYVTGNHEYYWGVEAWIQKVTQLGFIPLINENRRIEYRGKSILVAGVTDTSGYQFIPEHKSDPKKAIQNPLPTDFKLLLAHRPDSCFEAEPLGYHLQLSGHTHAGQFFPWSILVRLAHKYYKGLNKHGNLWVYVNSGTGYWGPPNRLAVPSEITLLRLVQAPTPSKS